MTWVSATRVAPGGMVNRSYLLRLQDFSLTICRVWLNSRRLRRFGMTSRFFFELVAYWCLYLYSSRIIQGDPICKYQQIIYFNNIKRRFETSVHVSNIFNSVRWWLYSSMIVHVLSDASGVHIFLQVLYYFPTFFVKSIFGALIIHVLIVCGITRPSIISTVPLCNHTIYNHRNPRTQYFQYFSTCTLPHHMPIVVHEIFMEWYNHYLQMENGLI